MTKESPTLLGYPKSLFLVLRAGVLQSVPKVSYDHALLNVVLSFQWRALVWENLKDVGLGLLIGSLSSGTVILSLYKNDVVNISMLK